jgi:hypothetical protein
VSRRRLGAAILSIALLCTLPTGPATATAVATSNHVGVSVVPEPLTVSLALSARQVRVGEIVLAFETVHNAGRSRVLSVTYRLLVASLGLRVNARFGAPSAIPGGGQAIGVFSICTRATGSYLVEATATGVSPDGTAFSATSPAILLTVGAQGRSRCR